MKKNTDKGNFEKSVSFIESIVTRSFGDIYKSKAPVFEYFEQCSPLMDFVRNDGKPPKHLFSSGNISDKITVAFSIPVNRLISEPIPNELQWIGDTIDLTLIGNYDGPLKISARARTLPKATNNTFEIFLVFYDGSLDRPMARIAITPRNSRTEAWISTPQNRLQRLLIKAGTSRS